MSKPNNILLRATKGVNVAFRRAGFQLVRTTNNIADLRSQTTDPIEATYLADLKPFILEFQLSDCRIIPSAAFACTVDCGNPFINTLLGYKEKQVTQYRSSPLEAFYQTWQPINAAAVLGLTDDDTSLQLVNASPFGFVMPWDAWQTEHAMQRWTSFIEKDNKENGINADIALGWKGWGPVGPQIGDLEFRRLTKVFNSIRSKGYVRNNGPDGDIKGFILEKMGEFRVIIKAGHHRAAALASLNQHTVPIRIDRPIVRYSDAAVWPNVRAGLFSTSQAQNLFDRQFAARQPTGYQPAALKN